MLECLRRPRRGAARARRRAGDPPRQPRARAAAPGARGRRRRRLLHPDVSPYARERGRRVHAALSEHGIARARLPGPDHRRRRGRRRDQKGKPYTVFSPFHRAWRERAAARRCCRRRARCRRCRRRATRVPASPTLGELGLTQEVERADARRRDAPRATALDATSSTARSTRYRDEHDTLGSDSTSRLSPYLHFGCVSAREVESRVPRGRGPRPSAASSPGATSTTTCSSTSRATRVEEFQQRYRRAIDWNHDHDALPRLVRGPRPASRSSTPACASYAARAGCTTARGSSSARS